MSSRQSNNTSIFYNKTGTITNGSPITVPHPARPGFEGQEGTIIKFLLSAAGGFALIKMPDGHTPGGTNYWVSLPAGTAVQFIINDPANTEVLISGTDWEGTPRTSTAADIQWLGE
jgi:hypothetical protein